MYARFQTNYTIKLRPSQAQGFDKTQQDKIETDKPRWPVPKKKQKGQFEMSKKRKDSKWLCSTDGIAGSQIINGKKSFWCLYLQWCWTPCSV